MGEVYRARDTRLRREVAVKVLPQHVMSAASRRLRFEREAQAIAALNHPNICALFDVGSQAGTEFWVMEYLEGETLEKRLVRGPLPLQQAVRYAIEIAGALDHAHRHGIVHRDLKPTNIILTRAGVKLLDFGLARWSAREPVLGGRGAADELPETQSLTSEGTILGTLQYMSPEQVEGKDADARADLFAFGAIVHEMVTGRRAFTGDSHAGLIAAILTSDPAPMTALEPLTTPGLERIVKKCLAKDPDARWQTARDLLDELKWVAESASPGAAPRNDRAYAPPSDGADGRRLVEKADRTPVKTEFRKGTPDGKMLAFAGGTTARTDIYVRQLAGGEALNLTANLPEIWNRWPRWSPDGTVIAFVSRGYQTAQQTIEGDAVTSVIRIVPYLGGTARKVVDARMTGHAWAPDGKSLVYMRGNEIHVSTLDGHHHKIASGRPVLPILVARWKVDRVRVRQLRFPVQSPSSGQCRDERHCNRFCERRSTSPDNRRTRERRESGLDS
jgi:hypothetical protein